MTPRRVVTGGAPKPKLTATSAALAAAKARGLIKDPPESVKESAPVPQKRHALSYARVGEILAILRRFPAFHQHQPLKIGIYDELVTVLTGEVDPAELSVVLRIWTGDHRYLNRISRGHARIGLDGKRCGEVPTDAHRAAAAAHLAALATKKGGAK